MLVQLTLNRNRKSVWTAQITQSEATLGRARGCNIRIPSSEVSRQHCRLRIESGVVTVEDLESANGTFLNGTRVRRVETVQPGDRLTLGPVTLVIEYEPSTDSLEAVIALDDDPLVEAEGEVEAIDDEMEVVEDPPSSQPGKSTVPIVEPTEEIEQSAQPLVQLEDTSHEVSILDDPSSEIRLPESGDDLRDFLIELDDFDQHSDVH
jgi:pSer/pThr/pTyr-binding forkhead associated (FHA) protein